MKVIAGKEIERQPSFCHECPFYEGYQGNNLRPPDTSGWCGLREKYKRRYDNVPKVCAKLFDKVFASDQEVWNVFA